MAQVNELPHFVRKQAERASNRLLQHADFAHCEWQIKGTRVILVKTMPHPSGARTVKMPIALLDFKNQLWHLLFRDTQGGWQPLPASQPSKVVDEKIDDILQDDYGVFLRQ